MPYKRPGTWEGRPHFRWKKMIRGQVIRIRCADDLHLPEDQWTELGSIKAASEFLEKKMGEQSARIERLGDNLAERAGNMAIAKAQLEIAEIHLATMKETADLTAMVPSLKEKLDGAFETAQAKLVHAKIPTEFSLRHHATRFLELERAKNNRPRTYGELSESINAMLSTTFKGVAVLSPEMDVRSIDKTTVENYFLFLRNKSGRVAAQQKKQWGFFKRLVRYFWETELINLPKNLDSNSFAFKVTASKIKRYDLDDVRTVFKSLPERLKLYALLSANCGMLTVDMGCMTKDEVDLTAGRIVRKRTKTSEEKDVPEVNYKLWPLTLKLLKKYFSDHETLALTSKTGTKLWEHWIGEDGKEHEKNLITLQWKKAKSMVPLKAFRSIGSTVIGDHKEFGRYYSHYLGHSPKSIGDKHYVPPSDELFDEIMEYVGKELRLA